MRGPDILKEGVHRNACLRFVIYQPAKLRISRESPVGRRVLFQSSLAICRAFDGVKLIALAVSRIEDRRHDKNRWEEHDQDSVAERLDELGARTGGRLIAHGATLREKGPWAQKCCDRDCCPHEVRFRDPAHHIIPAVLRPPSIVSQCMNSGTFDLPGADSKILGAEFEFLVDRASNSTNDDGMDRAMLPSGNETQPLDDVSIRKIAHRFQPEMLTFRFVNYSRSKILQHI
jgi:hypothetical protein